MAKITSKKQIEQYEHSDKERANNPQVGLVTPASDPDTGKKKTYQYDPHLDPQLQWAGKTEHTSFKVATVSLHVHERIDPKTIIETVRKEDAGSRQLSLFEISEKPLREAIDFYKHKEGWTNRLIAGDSLLVMNSLLEKEGMAGKVQMVYFDPPYGIKYGSNFQPFVNKRDVKDGNDEDLSAEPEMIKAFRDTWELGIHSYLTYLRDRLLLARELLHESGSVFVQISDENVHHVREIMDEVFGSEHFVSQITMKRASVMFTKKYLKSDVFYLLFYAKKLDALKYRQLYNAQDIQMFANSSGSHLWLEHKKNGESVKAEPQERKDIKKFLSRNPDLIPFSTLGLNAQGTEKQKPFNFRGVDYYPPIGTQWKTSYSGLETLVKKNRIIVEGSKIRYKYYYQDYPVSEIGNYWEGIGAAGDKIYVVQTNDQIIENAMMMTTDPGDLCLDITCGSGTTAYVAEKWGRRWMTCDTSRVAITLAKQRLMTANYDYYQLAHPKEGIGSGFVYKTVPHITLKSIANNEPPATETLYDQPLVEKGKARVTGPFTVEAVPAPYARSLDDLEMEDSGSDASIARTGETLRQSEWRDELLKTGVRGKNGQMLMFSRVEPLSGTRYIQAEAETRWSDAGGDSVAEPVAGWKPEKVLVVFGPEHAPLEQRMVENALEEARFLKPDILLFCAFQFDEEAAKDIDETPEHLIGFKMLKAQMNADLFTDDLRKKRSSNESFWLVGQPDVKVYSFEFLVFSDGRRLSEYGTFKKLSGLDSLAKINELSEQDIQFYAILSQGRDIWHYLSDEKGWDFDTGKYSGRSGAKHQRGICAVSWNSSRFIGGIRDFNNDLSEFGVRSTDECRRIIEQLRGNSQIVGGIKEIAKELDFPSTQNSKLKTQNFSQAEVLGFDYYNPKTGNIESGGKKNIAMWMLDTAYNNRSLFPSQVFFPMAGAKDGWAKLAKNLKAEINEEKIESFTGTVSLPFKPGKTIAVKIIDDRGIESLRVMKVA